jgi:hypothetical protein
MPNPNTSNLIHSNLKTLTASTVARVRSGVICALVCAATDLDESLRASLPQGRFALTISGPSGIRRRLSFSGGRAVEGDRDNSAAVLRFVNIDAMARALGGGKGAVIPLPLSPMFLRAVRAFITSSGRVGELSSLREFSGVEEKQLVTELLMTAALRGVAETAMADTWTAPKSSGMPDGVVELRAENLRGWVHKSGNLWRAGRGKPPAEVNARLSFADVDTAFGLFTGSVSALKALGTGQVSIRGKLPMIQIMFPLMDRFGEIMQWGKNEQQ